MISRIYVTPKTYDKQYNKDRLVINSYVIDWNFSKEELERIGQALTNPILENFSVDKFPNIPKNFKYLIEISFLPGVTDNVAHTVKETITDLLRLNDHNNLAVYTSKVFLISDNAKTGEVEKIALSLHNPLIEHSYVSRIKNNNNINLPLEIPRVILPEKSPVLKVPLAVDDQELIRIGKEGIRDERSVPRGPLALDLESMKVIQAYFAKLKRDPSDIELESLAQTWSEHCKHTIFANPIDDIKDGLYKTYIKAATNLIRKEKQKREKDFCVSVFSDNSGGIIFDENYLITHKVETHNSPSALDPFGGAITGIVGVNRDTIGFGLGAKPVANTYGFCFGDPLDTRPLFRDKEMKQKMLPPKRIMEGVIRGVNVGGNCSGIPTVSGFVRYDDRFRGKPLVFVGTAGIIPRKINGHPSYEKSAQVGDYIVVVGGRVGRDGIHGATFSSVVMDSSSPATAVQIGDPIAQKKLSDAIVKEARAMDLYTSITDNGAGGISCSVAEMAKECGGAKVDLNKVPLKYQGMDPWAIWISESQERMTLSVPKNKWKIFHQLMQSREVEATIIGEFTNSGKVIVEWDGKEIVNIEMEFLHNGLPKKALVSAPVIKKNPEPRLPAVKSYTKFLEELLGDKNVSGFSFISEQYDHEVQASSVLKPLSGRGRINTDAQVFKPVLASDKGVVLSAGIYPSYGDISTYHMASCALDTAVRNAVSAGATMSHLAILDNFCWCSSYDQARLAQLVDSVKACYDCAVGYGTPFISGKDSMFNDFRGYDEKGNPIKISIPPTLLISSIGVMQNINKTVSPEFKNVGDLIYLLGETHNELGGSEYFKMLGAIGNNIPKVDLKKNSKTYKALEKTIEKELLASAMSVTSGGFGIALGKACVGGMVGCKVEITNLKGNAETADAKLFSESQGRMLVSVSPKNKRKFEKLLKGVACTKLGQVSKDGKVVIKDGKVKVVKTNVAKLYSIYHDFSEKMK